MWRKNHASVVTHHGSAEDADALLPLFLAGPTERHKLLEPLIAHGNRETAKAIFDVCFSGGVLVEDVSSTVLEALGSLGFEEAEQVLWEHFLIPDHDIHEAATMGLLNLPCHGLIGEIESAVRHQMYHQLAEWWPLLSPPSDYIDEAAEILPLLAVPSGVHFPALLELGSGGGSLAWKQGSRCGASRIRLDGRYSSGPEKAARPENKSPVL